MLNYLKTHKKLIIILLAVLSVLSVFYIILSATRKTAPLKGGPLSAPKIPNYVSQTLPIQTSITKSDFNFPDKLPLLNQRQTTPLLDSQATSIAKNLGFTADPTQTKDVQNGTVYIWNNQDNFLVITPKIRKIDYGPNTSPLDLINNAINKQLSDQDMISIAFDFLVNKINIPQDAIKFNNFVYLANEKDLEQFTQTTKDKASVFQINFTLAKSQYPILTLDPRSSLIYVQILKDGSILTAGINLSTSFENGPTEYKLKNFTEFQSSITESILVNLNDGNVNLPDLGKDAIKNISINKIELAYLLDSPNSEYLQPVFLLKGDAQVQGLQNKVNAFLYLPAISKNP